MKTTTPLSNSNQRTLDRIFQHPISHNLEWRDVHSLLEGMGDVSKEHNGSLKVTRNGQTLVLHPTSKKDVTEMEEVMKLRHFIERSETVTPDQSKKEIHWLLVIDHHEARIFHAELAGAVPQRILPYEPGSYFRHAPDSVTTSRGQEKPDPNTFFEPVAKILEALGPILIFGTGKGTSSEMDQFVAWLKIHHPEAAKRIVGSVVVDEHHLTQDHLLANARDFYITMLKPD
jgi:hypothetical protein